MSQAKAQQPEHVGVNREVIGELRALKRFEEADLGCVALLSRAPDDVWALTAYGDNARASGDRNTALTRYQSGLTRHPENVTLLVRIGEELRALGRLDEALSHFASLPAHLRRDFLINLHLAYCHRALGDRVAALSYFEQVTCSPEMAPFFGRVRFARGRTNEAQQVQR